MPPMPRSCHLKDIEALAERLNSDAPVRVNESESFAGGVISIIRNKISAIPHASVLYEQNEDLIIRTLERIKKKP
jgi:hypothetical protein